MGGGDVRLPSHYKGGQKVILIYPFERKTFYNIARV